MEPQAKSNRWHSIARAIKKRSGALIWGWGGTAAVGVIAISCSGVGHQVFMPPSIPGAEFVGSEECATCHEDIALGFKTSDHARLQAKGSNVADLGCEGCHGPGSKHVEAGGGPGTIVNMRKNPEGCFKCHLDVKGSFNLPYAHPVLSGKMSCGDCHDPHKGSAMKGGGTQLAGINATCVECHTQQQGPFVFEHEATREGCVSCHSPHGSVNQKMLTERNSTLCLKCHFQDQTGSSLRIGGGNHSTSRLRSGTCWTAGCHEAVHGSNVSHHLRN
jgi:predicted CXXCH cytochrome family protein